MNHGFLYNGTTYTRLDAPLAATNIPVAGTFAYGISGNTVVGQYDDASRVSHGFLYNADSGKWTTIDPPGNANTYYAHGIDGDNIVGVYNNGTADRGFLYNYYNEKWTNLDYPLGGTIFDVNGISGNNIVGNYLD